MTGEEPQETTYALHTSAPFEIIREMAVTIAMKHGHVMLAEEMPKDAVIMVPPRRIWTVGRWVALLIVLAVAPLVIRYLNVTSLLAFYLGWIAAVSVVLLNRGPVKPR